MRVKLEDGRLIPLSELDIGHRIQVSYDAITGLEKFEPVIDIPHRNVEKLQSFVKISFKKSDLELTADHLIHYASSLYETFDPAQSAIKFAKDTQIGDLIWVGGKIQRIKHIERVSSKGVFTVHTPSGAVVVYSGDDESASEGIVASCYSTLRYTSLLKIYFRTKNWLLPPKSVAQQPHRGDGAAEVFALNVIKYVFALPSAD